MKLCLQYHQGLYTQFTKKKVFEQLTFAAASPVLWYYK